NGMIHPLVPYAMRGVIWYQGESNANRGEEYQTLFPALITDWRAKWKQELSFYFVQLANYGSEAKTLGDSPWAELREAQTKTLHLPKTGMAIAIDIGEGDDIHPKNKEDVGLRLAYHALAKDYGMDVAYEGPRFREMKVYDNKIFVGFDHAASGLLMGKGKEKLIGFLIAGEDRIFHPAEAYIQGKFVVVSSPKVTQPVAVRYAWAENPGDVNLYNREGLPAVPFRSDNWPLTSAGKRKVYVKE
ncbi:MAG: sialate O-acetylesterase, partial [Bacteroidota bacterium]